MDIDAQIEKSKMWLPGDPGPRPYDPDSAAIMRTATVLERVAELIKQDPQTPADWHSAHSDPELYRELAQTHSGRELLRLRLAEDPGLEQWLGVSEAGKNALGRAYLVIEEPDPTAAEEFVRRASSPRVAQARRRIVESRMEQHAGRQERVDSPRSQAARERARAAMLEAAANQSACLGDEP
ncbi:hypothetical protein ABZ502_17610 [Streptomyces abikoensis]|uniref:hypothetical protein n=1 Tax=Streptomyces abikoensis TaxID=97398 RepID=UPI0033D31A2C